ncbi:MAG: SDR family oxidoreductase [Anaerolineae bacterium]|nr:SDR family oxidoreductase [Phycisphaerae bacterium]
MLFRSGWRIAGVARSERDLGEFARGGEGILTLARDISTSAICNEIVAQVRERFGRIDALVNNAGYAPLLSLDQTTDEVWQQAIDTNLSAAFYLARACWPEFKKQSGGVIVNVSSAAARDPFPGFIAYGAAKAALNNLGLSLAREGAKDNIRVHTVAPSATETEMFRKLPGMAEYPAESTMSPEEVARVIVQCIAGELSLTSGEVIYLHKGA